jgi:hypothetical protein
MNPPLQCNRWLFMLTYHTEIFTVDRLYHEKSTSLYKVIETHHHGLLLKFCQTKSEYGLERWQAK